MVDIIEVKGNIETICGFVTHPLEIIKTAIIKTDTWNLEVNNHQNINKKRNTRSFVTGLTVY